MAKDITDKKTLDMLPKKRGAPLLDVEHGPMTASERKARQRAGKVTVEFHLSQKHFKNLDKLCGGLTRDEWIKELFDTVLIKKRILKC